MPGLPDGVVERVLVAVAHPDDAEFWAGGTIAGWTHAGIEVTYCVLTHGDAGGFDQSVPRREIPSIRRAEQQEAAALLGVRAVRFFGLAEGGLREAGGGLHEDLVRAIRQVRPQRVLTWSPEWNWQRFRSCHPAHLATGAAVLAAIYPDASNPFALTHLKDEGLDAWTVQEAWLISTVEAQPSVVDRPAKVARRAALYGADQGGASSTPTLAMASTSATGSPV